ncbi:MAG: hypothetical protein WBD58_10980 [Geitlerinemataceae cyanobacterium]
MSNFQKKIKSRIKHGGEDLLGLIQKTHLYSSIINQKEIRAVGLKRTGNHAILKWVKSQETGVVEHLNNVKPNENPFRDKYEHLRDRYPEHQGVIDRLYQQSKGKLIKKDCFIYSYEDWKLSKIATINFEIKHDLYVGKSLERYDVLILRDPFNLIASRLKYDRRLMKITKTPIVDRWVEYAREFLGETQYLKHHKICINYNRWFQDVEYRQHLADRLKLKFTDARIDRMSYHGGGSSFEGRKLDGNATQLDVINRWQHFKDDPIYQQLVDDDRLWHYCERIFDRIPNIDVLRRSSHQI